MKYNVYINPKELPKSSSKFICLYISQISGNDYYRQENNKIILFEDNEYQFHFKSSDEIEFDILEKDKVFKNIDFLSKYDCGGILSFYDYIGKTFINVNKESFEIEVRPRKMDYKNDYQVMIGELSGYLFQFSSPLFQKFKEDSDVDKHFYDLFMFLEYLFLDNNLPTIFEYLDKNLYHTLNKELVEKPISKASKVSPVEIKNSLKKSNNVIKLSDESKFYQLCDGYFPKKIDNMSSIDSIDNNENRFYKYFLEEVLYLIEYLIKWGKKHIKAFSKTYIGEKLNEFSDDINYYLSKNYFKDISKINVLPLNSQVLQKKEGYREIFKYYFMLQFNFNISWNELADLFKGYQKRLSNLYEIWIYFKLLDIFNDENYFEKCNSINIFEMVDDRIIKLKTGDRSTSLFKLKGTSIVFKLQYNKIFKNSDNAGNNELEYKPDCTLTINNDGFEYYIHFDAKYKFKIEKNSRYVKTEDIHKMHTYVDAINNTVGAYVLYPGKNKVIYSKNSSLCGVGAFPLNPSNFIDITYLKEFIIELLNNFIT